MRSPVRLVLAVALALPLAASEAPRLAFEAPGAHLADGVMYCPAGFVGTHGDMRVIADAARYDQQHDELFVTGEVVMTMRGRIRIAADRLGLRPQARTGHAWKVRVDAPFQGRMIRATAREAELTPTALILRDVDLDSGHGGIVTFSTSKLTIHLFAEPMRDRDGFEEYVSGVTLINPTGALVGLPVFWLPWAYRDYTNLYPWTKVAGGQSRRQGPYIRYWIGSNLPTISDWRTRLEARVEDNSRSGWGGGLQGFWQHPRWGTGQATWFGIPDETVIGVPSSPNYVVANRQAGVVDIEHQADLGRGAVALRFGSTPDGDPTMSGGPPGEPDNRFRSDYLPWDVDQRWFIRTGAAAAYSLPLGTMVVDTQHRTNPDSHATERWLGLHALLPATQLFGPLHLSGEGYVEDMHRELDETQALRTYWDGGMSFGEWIGPVGLDAFGGGIGLGYTDGEIAGTDLIGTTARMVPLSDGGVSLRLRSDWGRWTSVLTPRAGWDVRWNGEGDTLPAYGFGDTRDSITENEHFWTVGFTTSLARQGSVAFSGGLLSRWAMRQKDREAVDTDGTVRTGTSALAQVLGNLHGDLWSGTAIDANGTWDARLVRWTAFDTAATWMANPHAGLRYSGTLVPATSSRAAQWQNQPGTVLLADRYRIDANITLIPGGADIDQYFVQLRRAMIDGGFYVNFAVYRDSSGAISDHRFGLGYSMGGDDPFADRRTSGTTVGLP